MIFLFDEIYILTTKLEKKNVKQYSVRQLLFDYIISPLVKHVTRNY